jgi:tRNA(adenine34) deaminase
MAFCSRRTRPGAASLASVILAAMARNEAGRREKPAPVTREPHERFMRRALEAARMALHLGEVPIGAVVVANGEVLALGFNQPIRSQDPTAHAEIVALRAAARTVHNYRLTGTTLYVTVEPCLMCVGAIVAARVAHVVYGVAEPKFGAVSSILDAQQLALNHHFGVTSGILADECRKILVEFFEYRREQT